MAVGDPSYSAPAPAATWRAYVVDFLQAPGPAKAALVGCCILMIISPASLSAMTPFITVSFAADTGLALPEVMLLFVAAPLIVSPLFLPIAGAWVDRWGAKIVAVPASLLYAATTALVPFVGASAIPLLGLVLVLASIFGFMASLGVVFKVITSWFPQHRGIGFALMGAVSSLGAAALSPLFQHIIGSGGQVGNASTFAAIGWNGAYLLVAAAIALTTVPTAIFLISEPKRQTDASLASPIGLRAADRLPGVPLRKAVTSGVWISIALFLALAATGPMAVRQNAVTFFAERGFDPATIALSLSALFVASVVGLFVGGMILDRTRRPWVAVPILAAVPIGLVIAYYNNGVIPLLFVSTSLLGFATGAESALGPFLIARYFGLKAFAQLQGLTLAISTLVIGLSPFLVSAIQNATGSYFAPFVALTVLTAIAPVLAALLPKYPAEWEDVRQLENEPANAAGVTR